MTVQEALKMIPIRWRKADICILVNARFEPVERISLHQNKDGRKVVVICSDPIIIKP